MKPTLINCWLPVVALALPLLATVDAAATTVLAASEQQMVEFADAIFFGTVMHTETLEKEGGQAFTRAHVQVYDGILGVHGGQVIYVDVIGGMAANGIRTVVSGAPKVAPGDRVVGFLEKIAGVYSPLGLSYGWLRVLGEQPNALHVYRQLDGLNLVGPGGAPPADDVAVLAGMPLHDYLKRLRAVVELVGKKPVEPGDWQGPSIQKGVKP